MHYWRTKDGAEVDFVISRGEALIPIEVKYKSYEKPAYSRSFHNFLSKYNPADAIVINLTLDTTEKVGSTQVSFIPFYRLPELLASFYS